MEAVRRRKGVQDREGGLTIATIGNMLGLGKREEGNGHLCMPRPRQTTTEKGEMVHLLESQFGIKKRLRSMRFFLPGGEEGVSESTSRLRKLSALCENAIHPGFGRER